MARHPLTLLTRAVPGVCLRPGTSWLLAQDLHAPFTEWTGGPLSAQADRKVLRREFDEYTAALDVMAPNFARLLAAARASGLGIVFSCLGADYSAGPGGFQQATGWEWLAPTDATGFPSPFQPTTGEPIFSKPGWGALASPAFAAWLTDTGVASMLVCGTMLDFGLRQTCYELADRGIGCVLVADAAVPLTQAAAGPVTGNLAHGLIKLRTTAELLDLLATMREAGEVTI